MYYLIKISNNKKSIIMSKNYLHDFQHLSFTLYDSTAKCIIDNLTYNDLLENKSKLIGVVNSVVYVFSKQCIDYGDFVPKGIYLNSSPVSYLRQVYSDLDAISDTISNYNEKRPIGYKKYISGSTMILVVKTMHIFSPTDNYRLIKINDEYCEWLELYKYLIGIDLTDVDEVYLSGGNMLYKLDFNTKLSRYLTKVVMLED